MNIKIGDIILLRGDSVFSKLIYLGNRIHYGKKGYSHVGIVGGIRGDSVFIYEALSEGFTKSTYSENEINNFIKNDKLLIGKSKISLNRVPEHCEKYIGRSYAWYDIFQISLYVLFGVRKFFFSTGAKKLICSEAVSRILFDASNKQINFEKQFGKKFDLIMPQDLRESKDIRWEE